MNRVGSLMFPGCFVSVQQWHPDRWTRNPSLSGEAKRRFQQIQEAYEGKLFVSPLFFFFSVFPIAFKSMKGGVFTALCFFLLWWNSVVGPEEEDVVRCGVVWSGWRSRWGKPSRELSKSVDLWDHVFCLERAYWICCLSLFRFRGSVTFCKRWCLSWDRPEERYDVMEWFLSRFFSISV